MRYITNKEFSGINNSRLLKAGITNPLFNIIEDVSDNIFYDIKVGEEIIIKNNNKEITCRICYKYRDKHDIKIQIIDLSKKRFLI